MQTSDENKVKYQLWDYLLIRYKILQIDIIIIVWKTVRRITNEILGIKGWMVRSIGILVKSKTTSKDTDSSASVKSFISYDIHKFAGIFDIVISIRNNRQQNSRKIKPEIASVKELTKETVGLKGIPGFWILGKPLKCGHKPPELYPGDLTV